MSLYQCDKCGVIENTACGWYHARGMDIVAPEYKNKCLCSECGPTKYNDGTPTGLGEWHGRFEKKFYPLGTMTTDDHGNIRVKTALELGIEVHEKVLGDGKTSEKRHEETLAICSQTRFAEHVKKHSGTTPHFAYIDEAIPVASNIEEATRLLNEEQLKEHQRLVEEERKHRPLSRTEKRALQREKTKLEQKMKRLQR